jgi:hypothetical protein
VAGQHSRHVVTMTRFIDCESSMYFSKARRAVAADMPVWKELGAGPAYVRSLAVKPMRPQYHPKAYALGYHTIRLQGCQSSMKTARLPQQQHRVSGSVHTCSFQKAVYSVLSTGFPALSTASGGTSSTGGGSAGANAACSGMRQQKAVTNTPQACMPNHACTGLSAVRL